MIDIFKCSKLTGNSSGDIGRRDEISGISSTQCCAECHSNPSCQGWTWSSTSIFASLQCATKILKKNTCIISYADILYKQNAIKLLKQAKGDIVILNNTNWRKTWKKRFKTPLSDLES